ncbi:MAG: hypothetical protein JRJ09_03940 [Deltaproteobacteria bacterium]|nr:hypothetical protein [Deltaproteobacteria bacterium]MBW2047662.1 hypothetical protein [Deltaproteobacteria bacterium]MBW2110274.1 hypothetical protein [Deltaproteobacteria bacterium]MBW2352504.1 hypothetical protein [Deltaproteobacteria bacterium]
MKKHPELSHIENVLHHLNYRWKLQALAMWKGDRAPFEPYRIYDEYDGFIGLDTLRRIEDLAHGSDRIRLKHALIDHYLQRALLPHETEMRTWMKGAAAHVNGRKIYFKDIISFCQKQSSYRQRQALQKETGPLCKFLKPFALNHWRILLRILTEELSFDDYIGYCREKKGLDYTYYHRLLEDLLAETDDIYFPAMDHWCRKRFNRPLDGLTRFDAINILGLGHLDHLFPEKAVSELTTFFEYWDIDLASTPGLNLEIGRERGKSSQAICFILQVPEEVYVLMQPEGGWVDLETLWHELGHGLSAVFTSPELPALKRDLATSFGLSEAFAFLNQNLTLSTPFLQDYLGLYPGTAQELSRSKALKDLALFRRYAAKFLAEYRMFSTGDLSDGEPYAEIMARYTGFYYQPESHLFDLVPELYSLDYILGWLTESIMEAHLRETLGRHWMFRPEAGGILKGWWHQGNQHEIPGFLRLNGLGQLSAERIVGRWQEALKG